MSGTSGYINRQKAERQRVLEANREKVKNIQINRAELVSVTSAFLTGKYGEDAFIQKHPLVIAILKSANGAIVDIPKLQTDIEEFENGIQESA
jgi:hypothetical protein